MTKGRSKQNKARESPTHSLPSAADGSSSTPARRSSHRRKGTPSHPTRRGMTTHVRGGTLQQVPSPTGTAVNARALASTTPPPMGTSTNTSCSSPPTDAPLSINAPTAPLTDPSSTSTPLVSLTDILPSTVAPSASSANKPLALERPPPVEQEGERKQLRPPPGEQEGMRKQPSTVHSEKSPSPSPPPPVEQLKFKESWNFEYISSSSRVNRRVDDY